MATKVYELIAPCHFGLEAILKREIFNLGYEISKVEDGRVTFSADAAGICRAATPRPASREENAPENALCAGFR